MQPKTRRQRPVKGGRQRIGGSVLREIDRAVARTAERFHVSRSFVIAEALADIFGIVQQERIADDKRTRKRP